MSRQLGHKDASITLRVYAHWLPMLSNEKLVDVLDDAAPRGSQTAPAPFDQRDQIMLSALNEMVSRVGIESEKRGRRTKRELRRVTGNRTRRAKPKAEA